MNYKTIIYYVLYFFCQTVPRVVANFGIDGDLHADTLKFGGIASPAAAGTDDWFVSNGIGRGLIDTTGAKALYNFFGGGSGPTYNTTFAKGGAFKLYTPVNNNLVISANYGRDQVSVSPGSNPDESNFNSLAGFGASKNGMNPRYWVAGVGNPAANVDVVDGYSAFRRQGTTVNDTLFLIGGVYRVGVTGQTYFDFEYLQDSIKWNKTTGSFTYAADTGHTAWKFSTTTGLVTKVGDVVFSAQFGTAGLTTPELRIWCRYSDWRNYAAKFPSSILKFLTPGSGGTFEGHNGTSTFASRKDTFGYALIQFAGTCIIYNMYNNTSRTPAPPWGSKNAANNRINYYPQNSFIDFALNLTGMGVDPKSLFSNPCIPLFSSLMIKTRSSASFTSDLKDLLGPLDLRIPNLLTVKGSNDTITCTKPFVTLVGKSANASNYYDASWTWKTLSGSGFVNPTRGGSYTTIGVDTVAIDTAYANKEGKYVVTVSRYIGCNSDSRDTITVLMDTATAPISIQVTDSVCTGFSANRAKIFSISPTFSSSLYTLVVSGPSGYNKTNKYKDTVLVSGTYTATITTKSNGCFRVVSLSINTFPGCTVSLSGSVFNDGNGLTDNKVNTFGIGSLPATALYANLLDATATSVIATTTVSGGTYSFPTVAVSTNYIVQLSTNQGTVSSAAPAVALPTNWVNTGEFLGLPTVNGNDGTINSLLPVAVATSNVTNANFGIDERPTSNNLAMTPQNNPGIGTYVSVGGLTGADLEDGTKKGGNTIVISSLAVNGTARYNGTAVTVGQIITGYIPSLLQVTPNFNGAGTVTFTYVFKDSAGFDDLSPATVDVPFTALTVSGKLFNDLDGNRNNAIDHSAIGVVNSLPVFANFVDGGGIVICKQTIDPILGT